MRLFPALCLVLASAASGCTHFHTNMLAESIKTFTSKAPTHNEKVWVASIADSNACDSGCQSPTSCGGKSGSPLGGKGLFGGFGGGGGGSDRLAYEVISNFLTQNQKMKVIESHRHNYSTDTRVETRKKIDTVIDGKALASGMSCEDLCLLDEAKKRSADKVLTYHIISMEAKKLTIHYRLSDVKSGVVEASHTLHVSHPTSVDTSFVEPAP
jgi:hypothetical protein